MKKALLLMGACLALAAPARAVVLANWTFETSIPTTAGPHNAEVGSGQALGSHANAATYSNPSGNGSVESFSSDNWSVNDYYQFRTSSVGYNSITIQWDQTASNTGPRDFSLRWSTDGVNFTALGGTRTVLANAAPNPVWSAGTYQSIYTFGPVAAPASLDNQANIYFRLVDISTVSANGGTVASGGTNRVDSVIISGTEIPEPATMALLALGGLVMIRRNR